MSPEKTEEQEKGKTIGIAIDEAIGALEPLPDDDRLTAIEAVCRHLNIPLGREYVPEAATAPDRVEKATEPLDVMRALVPEMDIRSLKEEKRPRTNIEMAAIVAYYLAYVAPEEERKNTVTKDDIENYFRQADHPIPSRVTLVNAKAAGYFDSVGSGEYKLNSVGYNLVAHGLPREERVKTKPPRAKAKKANKKKGDKKETKKMASKEKEKKR